MGTLSTPHIPPGLWTSDFPRVLLALIGIAPVPSGTRSWKEFSRTYSAAGVLGGGDAAGAARHRQLQGTKL